MKVWTALGVSLLLIERQEAATTVWQFEVTVGTANTQSSVVSGDTFLGELSYGETTAPTIAAPDLKLEFYFAGEYFDSSDDKTTGYPLFIQDPDPALTFCVDLEPRGYATGSFFHIYPDNSFQYSLDGASEYEGWLSFQPVPEPNPLVLFLSGSLVAVFFNRQRKQL